MEEIIKKTLRGIKKILAVDVMVMDYYDEDDYDIDFFKKIK